MTVVTGIYMVSKIPLWPPSVRQYVASHHPTLATNHDEDHGRRKASYQRISKIHYSILMSTVSAYGKKDCLKETSLRQNRLMI